MKAEDTVNSLTLFISIMRTTLHNFQIVTFYPKYNSILFINTDTPVSGQVSAKRFRFPGTFISISVNII